MMQNCDISDRDINGLANFGEKFHNWKMQAAILVEPVWC